MHAQLARDTSQWEANYSPYFFPTPNMWVFWCKLKMRSWKNVATTVAIVDPGKQFVASCLQSWILTWLHGSYLYRNPLVPTHACASHLASHLDQTVCLSVVAGYAPQMLQKLLSTDFKAYPHPIQPPKPQRSTPGRPEGNMSTKAL